ncbi:MAG: 16S rRNA (uracil(1498)-N(3))-methyltransferase [Candidatus Margulisiibacteriota bacterium]
MPRFFVSPDQIPVISGEDVHHIRDVLRMQLGEELELLDGNGKAYQVKIAEYNKNTIICQILSTKTIEDPTKVKITLAQCLPKADKMKLIIQKSSELGVWSIIPIRSERTIAKSEKKERWQTIAKEAAQQCRLTYVPNITEVKSFKEILSEAKDYSLAIIPWENEQEKSLKSLISISPDSPSQISRFPDILILIGPEGGFSTNEIELAKHAGFIPVSLGPRILRTETAGLAMLAMINYEFGQ